MDIAGFYRSRHHHLFVFAEIPELEPVCEWFLPLSRPILPSFMFLILFTVFCKVDFKKLRPVKWQMWVAIQQVVFVLLIVGLILVFIFMASLWFF